MIKLFELGDNNMATLNKPWISLIPEFRALLARDKGGPGDGSGKYKKKATREFTLLFLLLDFHSPYEEEPDDLRLEHSLSAAGIEPEKWEGDYKRDAEFLAAMAKYKDMLANSSVSLRGLRSMKAATHAMYKHLEEVDFTEETNAGGLKYDIKKVQEAIRLMPKQEEALAEMESKVKAQINDTTDMWGDSTKGFEEDPDNDD